MKTLTKDSPGIVVELFCREEYAPIGGNALASGDDAEDRKQEQWIRDQLDAGNEWAWCTAEVRVTYRDVLTASDSLGCCSYLGATDFRDGGYFADMVETCMVELNRERAAICDC